MYVLQHLYLTRNPILKHKENTNCLGVAEVPVCCKSLLSEEELIDQLVSRCPVQPGCRPKSTGHPKDSRNSRKWGWTLNEDSTFFRIWRMQKIALSQHPKGILTNAKIFLLKFTHLVTAFLSSPHIKYKNSVKWSAGEQVQVADVIKKPRHRWVQGNQMRR